MMSFRSLAQAENDIGGVRCPFGCAPFCCKRFATGERPFLHTVTLADGLQIVWTLAAAGPKGLRAGPSGLPPAAAMPRAIICLPVGGQTPASNGPGLRVGPGPPPRGNRVAGSRPGGPAPAERARRFPVAGDLLVSVNDG